MKPSYREHDGPIPYWTCDPGWYRAALAHIQEAMWGSGTPTPTQYENSYAITKDWAKAGVEL